MKELRRIAAAWMELKAQEEPAVLATVVETSGSTYRRPGARLLMTQERWLAGGISGGCLEGEVLKKAWWRTADGPVLLSYDSTGTDDEVAWSFGLGCNGRVEVLQERVLPVELPTHPLDFITARVQRRLPGVMATVFRVESAPARVGERLLLDETGVRTDVKDTGLAEHLRADAEAALAEDVSRVRRYSLGKGQVDALVEVVRPPRPLFVFGNGQDAVPLVRLAAELGFWVTLIADRPSGVPADAFREADVHLVATPKTAGARLELGREAAVVVMTHNLEHDRGFLRLALDSPAGYVGALGPKMRTEQMLRELSEKGFRLTEAHRRRLHSPIGLDLGAEQSEEIALAVLGEVLACFSNRAGNSLRLRAGEIHAREGERAG